MIRIPIEQYEIEWAKEETKIFDAKKTYNKFYCVTNYIGLLGEKVLRKWLMSQRILHQWVEFTKPSWEEPDFIIKGKTIDLKTSMTTAMWIQKPIFDYYLFARVNPDMKELFLISYIKGIKLQELIDSNELGTHPRDNSVDFTCKIEQMTNIEDFKLIQK